MIKFNNVTKVFNNTLKAVDDLSFTVNKGEIVGFIGPNGSGKTTTIKMLTGILSSDSGEISINGHDIKKEPLEAKKSIGYIADSPDMFLRLKGIEFLNLSVTSTKSHQMCAKRDLPKFATDSDLPTA